MQKLNPAGLSLKSFKRSCCGVRFQVLLGWGNIGRAEDGSSSRRSQLVTFQVRQSRELGSGSDSEMGAERQEGF